MLYEIRNDNMVMTSTVQLTLERYLESPEEFSRACWVESTFILLL